MRREAKPCPFYGMPCEYVPMAEKAQDRIEKLEATLRDIIIHCDWPDRVEKYARAALEVHSIGHEDGLCPRERA